MMKEQRSSATRTGAIFAAFVATAAVATAASSGQAHATAVVVLGDSIGVGISMAAKAPRLAHNSVAIRSDDIIQQIRSTPSDRIAFLSLGTNDAVGSIKGVERGIDRIVDAANRSHVRLVWVGPPCVRKSWNTNATKLDAILRARLSDKVTYVSVADDDVCARDLRAKDGVHFNMKGYAMLWERARNAVKEPLDVAPTRVADAGEPNKHAADADEPAKPTARHKRHRKHKIARHRQDEHPQEEMQPMTRTSSLEREKQ